MTVTLTKTRMIAGIWEGIFAGVVGSPPQISVTHQGEQVDGSLVKKAAQSDDWVVHVPIPAHLLSDGVQTFVISDVETGETLNSFTLLAGDALSEDIREEMALLREELDMLKSAFRRHCVETA
ncbi:MAG: hypothetical protein ACI9TA_002059 [Reinekea sp.]|jgi:type II secretory pathway predicted ATPase ExeA